MGPGCRSLQPLSCVSSHVLSLLTCGEMNAPALAHSAAIGWGGRGLPGRLPSLRGFHMFLWERLVPTLLSLMPLSPSTCTLGAHQLSAFMHLSTVYQVLGSCGEECSL